MEEREESVWERENVGERGESVGERESESVGERESVCEREMCV